MLRAVPPLGIGAEQTRVTSVAGSSTGVGGCNASESSAGGFAAAIAGVLPPGQTLHPFNQVIRTGILVPDNIDINHFFPAFGGRVQLGTSNADCTAAGAPSACCTGAGTGSCSPLNVCHVPAFDCAAQPNVQALVPLSSATGGIPAACVANGVSARRGDVGAGPRSGQPGGRAGLRQARLRRGRHHRPVEPDRHRRDLRALLLVRGHVAREPRLLPDRRGLDERGEQRFGAHLPINPSGGVLCWNPIGASGMLRLGEAALQVMGRAGAHQLEGARTAFGHAYGGGAQYFAMWVVGSEPSGAAVR